MNFSIQNKCRVCLNDKLTVRLQLNPTPPANELLDSLGDSLSQEKFPLYLVSCDRCGQVQLPTVISPERLFSNYVYVSGTSPVFIKHFEDYSNDVFLNCGLEQKDLVVEIGSNDGTLLKFFKQKGCRVVGVDPAKKISQKANEEGILTRCEFFNSFSVESILKEFGKAKIIIANNVFAHSDDIRSIVSNVRNLLDSNGYFIFEVSYLVDVLEKTLFDTIYHEHTLYYHISPLRQLFQEFGMNLCLIDRVNTHGGSIRCYVSNDNGSPPSIDLLEKLKYESEIGLKTNLYDIESVLDPFVTLKNKIDELSLKLRNFISESKSSGRKIVGYGAPAKATTLLHQFGISNDDISYIVDDSPWKQNKYIPGKGIEIVSSEYMKEDKPDDIIILAWNFADSIISKNQHALNRNGRIIVPLPEFLVYEQFSTR